MRDERIGEIGTWFAGGIPAVPTILRRNPQLIGEPTPPKSEADAKPPTGLLAGDGLSFGEARTLLAGRIPCHREPGFWLDFLAPTDFNVIDWISVSARRARAPADPIAPSDTPSRDPSEFRDRRRRNVVPCPDATIPGDDPCWLGRHAREWGGHDPHSPGQTDFDWDRRGR
jgi:hypothetical protein